VELLQADGYLHRCCIELQLVACLLHDAPGVGAQAVELVDEDEPEGWGRQRVTQLLVMRMLLMLHGASTTAAQPETVL
jgi:hypothetical protein